MNDLIGKSEDEIEEEYGLCWYVEFKPKKMFGFDFEEHNRLMKAFIEFLPKEDIRILKLNDGVVENFFELSYHKVLENIELLGEKEGKLYEEEDEISYSILTDKFIAIIQRGMIFWSSGKELAKKWCETLTKEELDFHEMSFVGGERDKEEESLWEDKTKINGVWVNDKTGEILKDEI